MIGGGPSPILTKDDKLHKMKIKLLFLLTTIVSIHCHSQISFEKGYFIDDNNYQTDCLIKNIDWKNNPSEFEYKLSEEDESKKLTIESVKEFGFGDFSKYVKAIVNIDRSDDNINKLSNEKNPVFKEEVLFLKVLIEGKINLYQYIDGSVKKFFYGTEDSNIEQLIYKIYNTKEKKIPEDNKLDTKSKLAVNNAFRQQLWRDLKCPKFNINTFSKLGYFKKDLMKIFAKYSECHNDELIDFEQKHRQKQDVFKLAIRPRLNYSSLSVKNAIIISNDIIEFEPKTSLGFGLEAEFILPYNKNKWAILIEPTFQNFKSEGLITDASSIFRGELRTKIDYSSIEVPIGLRHYFFFNDSRIFMNASVVFDMKLKSDFEGSGYNGSDVFTPIKRKATTGNFAFGIGYKLFNKYSLEIRHQTGRQIIGGNEISKWISSYKTSSIILGYSFF